MLIDLVPFIPLLVRREWQRSKLYEIRTRTRNGENLAEKSIFQEKMTPAVSFFT